MYVPVAVIFLSSKNLILANFKSLFMSKTTRKRQSCIPKMAALTRIFNGIFVLFGKQNYDNVNDNSLVVLNQYLQLVYEKKAEDVSFQAIYSFQYLS